MRIAILVLLSAWLVGCISFPVEGEAAFRAAALKKSISVKANYQAAYKCFVHGSRGSSGGFSVRPRWNMYPALGKAEFMVAHKNSYTTLVEFLDRGTNRTAITVFSVSEYALDDNWEIVQACAHQLASAEPAQR